MLNIIIGIICEHSLLLGGILLLAISLIIITVKATRFFDETRRVCKAYPKFDTTLKEISGSLGSVKASLNTLNTVLLEKNIISQSCYSVENSPRVLNAIGKQLYKDSGAESLMEKLGEDLLKEMESKKYDSSLEVERESLKLLLSKMEDKEFKELQDFAFNHPTFNKQALTYSDILFVMALNLRDKYLNTHPDFEEDNG